MVVFRELRDVARRGDYSALCDRAEQALKSTDDQSLAHAFATILWAYALLRKDAHRHHYEAISAVTQYAPLILSQREESPDDIDWIMNIVAGCYQLTGDLKSAESVLRASVERLPVNSLHRCVALGGLGEVLNGQGRRREARRLLEAAAQELDELPEDVVTSSVARERERVRLNLIDTLMKDGDLSSAEMWIAQLSLPQFTPVMMACLLIQRTRLAIHRDEWHLADQIGQQAYAAAQEVGYIPLRRDALAALIVIAGRMGQYDEQARLMDELAALRSPAAETRGGGG